MTDAVDPDTRDWIEEQRAAARIEVFRLAIPHALRDARLDHVEAPGVADAATGWLHDTTPTLAMDGAPQSGKSFAAYALLWAGVDRGLRVHGCTARHLIDSSRPEAEPSPAPRLAGTADLFLIDAADRDSITVYEWEHHISSVIAERAEMGLRTVITSRALFASSADTFWVDARVIHLLPR